MLIGDKDVGSFYVAMQDAFSMQVLNGKCYFVELQEKNLGYRAGLCPNATGLPAVPDRHANAL